MDKDEILEKIENGTFYNWFGETIPQIPGEKSEEFSQEVFFHLNRLVAENKIHPYRTMRQMGHLIPQPGTVCLIEPQ